MNPLKNILRDLLLSAGYDIRKTSHIGLDGNFDIQRMFGKRALRTIFDVGAHVGESAMEYARKFPLATIYSFEPFPKTFTILQENVAPWPHVRPVNSAIGDSCSTQTLFVNQFSATNSLLPARPDVADPGTRSLMKNVERVETPVTTLDTFCRDNQIATIDLLKIDVQGFESKVIAGASELLGQRRIALIYTEVTFESHYKGQTTFSELYAMLIQFGYELVDLYSHTRTTHHSVRWCDILFVNPLALERAINPA